jgi:hypothetical protein
MAESILPVESPWGGLSEAFAFSDQPANTAREFQNLRLLDPRTGRARLAQRSGLSKYMSSALKVQGTKVSDLLSFFEDNRQVTYSAIASGSETVTWDAVTPSKKDCLNVKTDRQGNVYALDGNTGIVKLSADEQQLWQVALPVTDPNHVVRALDVDEFDRIYVGVAAGGEQAKAKLICYEQLPDNKTELLWEVMPGGYIEDCVAFQDKLYTIQNHPDVMRSYVRIYDFIDEVEPELVQTWQVPHPANSIAVKKDGSVLVACEPSGDTTGFYWRNPDPRHPNFNVTSEDWTPKQLTNYDKRVWGWWVADDIDQSDAASTLENGVQVLRWRDRTKNLRHWYAAIDELHESPVVPYAGPIFAKDALNGHAGLRWNVTGTHSAEAPWQRMKTLPSSSLATTFADQMRSALPAYTNSGWALYMVIRPSQSIDSDEVVYPRWLIGQDRDGAASGSDDHMVFMNANDNGGNTLPPTMEAGKIYWYTGETLISGGDGGPGNNFILNGEFNVQRDGTTENPGNFVILGMVCDGNISNTAIDTNRSIFQTNGCPVDSFLSRSQFTLDSTSLGVVRVFGTTNPSGSAVRQYLGDILEIITLDRRTRTTDSDVILTYDDLQHDSIAQSQTINENTLIVGYLAHKYGAQANLPYGTAATDNYPHPFGITGTSPDQLSGPPNQAGTAVSEAQAKANKRFGCVVKYSAEGKIKWCANEMETVSGNRTGGYGYAVAVNSEGNIYSIGPEPTGPGADDNATIRLIIDQGDDFSVQVADGAWSDTGASQSSGVTHPRIDVDGFDNVYVTKGSANIGFRVYTKTGSVLHSYTGATGANYAIAVDRRIPDYRSDLATKTVEHLILATGNDSDEANPTLHKIRLVSAAQSGDSPRALSILGVSGGDIKKFTTAGVSTPTGGTGALDSGAYIQSTTLFKRAYWTDGRQYQQYSPQTNLITTYKATSAGGIPARCALIETWRGRIVLARSADEPHNWFLSKKDEPDNWDFFPPVPTETDAVAGNNSPAGLCPDIINAVVPYSEDILVFGGDHSIWALVGDPAAGGRLELVSDTTGMAFGRPWCKDPAGVLYFFGSQGGLFRWTPAARPERVSLNKIERSLQDVDLSAYYIRLVYNHRDEGIHILQIPFGAGATHVTHWFFELKTESFAEDHFGTSGHTNVQPTAAMVLDGDEFDDRLVLFGCEDGYVRKWDRAAKSDDTRSDGSTKIAIDSFVTIGPLQGSAEEQSGGEFQFSGLTVVLSEQDDGARYEFYAAEAPDSIGAVVHHGDLAAGRNPPRWHRVCGAYAWLRLRNAAPEQRWSLERAHLRVSPAGMARPRST